MTIMPDGRPFFAWKNELEYLRNREPEMLANNRRVDALMKLLRIAEIEQRENIATGDIVIRFRMVDAVRNLDFETNPEKYYQREAL